jgi:glycerophosphoryl diester phosphodiesterase
MHQGGPVLVTLLAATLTIASLAFGPGSLTSRANARAHAEAEAAKTATAVTPARPPRTLVPPHLIQIIGLGGGSDWGASNTLSAIENAVAAGVDGVEFDVRLTADGLPVVFPAAGLPRTTECTGPMNAVTFSRLTQCGLVGARGVSTLDSVLARVAPGQERLYLWVASVNSAEAAGRIMTLVDHYHLNDPNRLTVLASSTETLERMRAAGARDLGLAFGDASGWNSPYRVLVVLASKTDAAQVADARRRGHFVIVVQDAATPLTKAVGLWPNGLLVSRVGEVLR